MYKYRTKITIWSYYKALLKIKKTCIARKKFITNFTNRQDFAHYCNLKEVYRIWYKNGTKYNKSWTKCNKNVTK